MESQLMNISVTRYEKKKELMKPDDKKPWADLPSDVLHLIFSHLLDAFDCIRFRFTCIEWQLAVYSPLISPSMTKLVHYLLTLFPWHMFFSAHRSHGTFDFFHPITNESYTLHIPELANCTFHCSRYGWLLMSRDATNSIFFYNPLIPKSTINLPNFPEYNIYMSMSFTAPPTSPDCIVFTDKSLLKKCYTCRRGEDHWRIINNNNNNILSFKAFYSTPLFYKGLFYQLDRIGRLVVALDTKELLVLDDDDGNRPLSLKYLPKSTKPNIPDTVSHYNKYIAECEGEFVSVFMDSTMDYPVHVFKLDWSEMEWVTVKSLGNKTMFIGKSTGCLLVPAAKTIYQNRIYFTNYRNKKGPPSSQMTKDKTCVYYSLETRKFHAFGRDFSGKNLWGTASLPESVWIEPNLNITQDEVEDNWFR